MGVSFDSSESHQKFKDKHKLPFILLSDEKKEVAEAYGASGGLLGSFTAKRYTYLIDENGKIVHVFTKVDVKNHAEEVMHKVADVVKKYPNAKIQLDGFTDTSGTEAHNRRLSKDRAEAVKEYLIKETGINPSQIFAFGRGDSKPVADNKTEKGRFENRTVEILILQE